VNFQASGSSLAWLLAIYDHGERFAQLPRDQGGDDHRTDGSAASATPDLTAMQRAGTDGSILTASASGGTVGYTFSKDGVNFQASGVFTGLAAGDYTITAKDSHNCLGTKAVTITQPAAVTASATPTAPQCNGGTDGSIKRVSVGWHGGLHLLKGRVKLPGFRGLHWPGCWRLYVTAKIRTIASGPRR